LGRGAPPASFPALLAEPVRRASSPPLRTIKRQSCPIANGASKPIEEAGVLVSVFFPQRARPGAGLTKNPQGDRASLCGACGSAGLGLSDTEPSIARRASFDNPRTVVRRRPSIPIGIGYGLASAAGDPRYDEIEMALGG